MVLYRNMKPIATYVFFDLETSGLPQYEHNRTKMTELCMVAVKREHILGNSIKTPRVKHKLTLCFNPGRMIDPVSTQITGLCNDLLEHEPYFNMAAFDSINSFLNLFEEPLCLIAHNGNRFDFPILRNHLATLKIGFSKDLMTADTFFCFYDVLDPTIDSFVANEGVENEVNEKEVIVRMQLTNEVTPKKRRNIEVPNRPCKVRRKLPWGLETKPKDSYKLEEVYKRVIGEEPVNSHQAENDCIMSLKIAVALKDKFVKWVDENCQLFTEIEPMKVGVPM